MSKVSIIVPVYKVEKYIYQCVDNLMQQTLKDIEIILVDDGSPDSCPVICDQYAKKDERIKVIHKKNEGVSAARNDGLKVAKGEYVIFCDSDDWMEKDGCEKLYSAAIGYNADIAIGDVYMAYESGERKNIHFYSKEFNTKDSAFIKEMIQGDIYRTYAPCPPKEGYAFGYGGPWNKLVKRALLTQNNIHFDVRVKGVFDDILYTAHILAAASKISYVRLPVYNYRIIESSITHSYKPNVLEINRAIFDSWIEFFNEQNGAKTYQSAFYACVLRRIEESIRLYFVNGKNPRAKRELVEEYKTMLKSEPYCTAIRKANLKKVSKKQKMIAVLSRIGLGSMMWKVYRER